MGAPRPVRGTVPGGSAGVRVDVLGRACYGFKTRVVATAITRAGGTWRASVRPRSRTDYTARVGIETTPTLVVQVRPKVTLTKVASGGFRVRVLAAHSLGGQVVLLQRRVGGRWVRSKRLVLRRTGRRGKSVVSGRSFSAPVPRGRGCSGLCTRCAAGASATSPRPAGRSWARRPGRQLSPAGTRGRSRRGRRPARPGCCRPRVPSGDP